MGRNGQIGVRAQMRNKPIVGHVVIQACPEFFIPVWPAKPYPVCEVAFVILLQKLFQIRWSFLFFF